MTANVDNDAIRAASNDGMMEPDQLLLLWWSICGATRS